MAIDKDDIKRGAKFLFTNGGSVTILQASLVPSDDMDSFVLVSLPHFTFLPHRPMPRMEAAAYLNEQGYLRVDG